LVQAVAAKEEAEPAPVEPPPAAQEPVAEGAPTNGDEGGA